MTEKDKINKQQREEQEAKEKEALEAKYQDMTHCEALNGFYWWCRVAKYFFGGLSVLFGIGLPLMMAHKMPSVSGIVFTIFLVILIVMESSKGWVMDRINTIRIINREKSEKIPMKRFLLAACFLFAVNVAISFFSSPFIVDTLIEPSGLNDIALIDTIYAHKEQEQRERFEAAKKEFQAQADTIRVLNTKANGTLKSAVVRTHAEMTKGAIRQLDSLTATLSALKREHSNRVSIAESENKEIMKKHTAFCDSFSWWSALAACIIEVLLVTLAWWIADFDYKKLGELKVKAQGQPQSTLVQTTTQSNSTSTPSKVQSKGRARHTINKAPLTTPTPQRSMQIVTGQKVDIEPKEGDIVKEEGKRDRVLVDIKGKGLVPKTEGELGTLISAQGKNMTPRKEHLINLLKKFEA